MRTISLKDGQTVTVRPWQEQDIQKLYRMMEDIGKEGHVMLGGKMPFGVEQLYQQFYYTTPDNHATLVAVKPDGNLSGWIRCDRSIVPWMGHNAYLWLGVAPSERGQGIGEELIKAAFDWASQHGIERVELGVRGSNSSALALYEKMGFHEEGRKLRAIKLENGYDDDIWMGIFLDKSGNPKKLKRSVQPKKRPAKKKITRA